MTRQLALAVILLLTLGLLAGPGLTEDDPAPKPKPAEKKEADAPKATATAVVKLLSAGAEPHKKLRYAPAPDTKVAFENSIISNVETPMGAMAFGPIKMGYSVGFSKGEKDGALALTVEITSAALEGDTSNPMLGGMKKGIESSKGEKMAGEISTRGIWLTEPEKDKRAQREIRASVLNMLPPLPEEAVGVGAKWSVTVQISVKGIKQTSVSTVELTKCDGSRIEIAFEEKRTAKDASMTMQGMEVKIPSLSGAGKGTAVIDLALAGTVKSASTTSIEMTMDMMGQQMQNKSKITSTLTGAAPAAVTTTEAK